MGEGPNRPLESRSLGNEKRKKSHRRERGKAFSSRRKKAIAAPSPAVLCWTRDHEKLFDDEFFLRKGRKEKEGRAPQARSPLSPSSARKREEHIARLAKHNSPCPLQ